MTKMPHFDAPWLLATAIDAATPRRIGFSIACHLREVSDALRATGLPMAPWHAEPGQDEYIRSRLNVTALRPCCRATFGTDYDLR